MTQETLPPDWNGHTVGDLVEYAQSLEAALAYANADKTAIRAILAAEKEYSMGKEQ